MLDATLLVQFSGRSCKRLRLSVFRRRRHLHDYPLNCTNKVASNMIMREFGIKGVRYVNSCIALVGETAIRFLSNPAQESIVASLECT